MKEEVEERKKDRKTGRKEIDEKKERTQKEEGLCASVQDSRKSARSRPVTFLVMESVEH